jgi:hypothetical protein
MRCAGSAALAVMPRLRPVVDDFNVMRVAGVEAKDQAPRTVDGYGPMTRPTTAQLMQPDAAQMAQVVECFRGIQLTQAQPSSLLIHARPFPLPLSAKRRVAVSLHDRITCATRHA